MDPKVKKILLIILVIVIGINNSFLGSSGILIFNLKSARNIYSQKDTKHVTFDRLISDKLADNIYDRVLKLKPHWKKKNPVMYTLGIGSYIEDDYHSKVKESNKLLYNNFSDMYKIVLDYFKSSYPNTNVKYRTDCGLPGFHIFECNSLFSLPVSSVHVDRQWNRIKHYPNEDFDLENTLSFTLTIKLPKSGGGLYIFKNIPENCLIPKPLQFNLADKEKINYRKGYFVLHTGNTTHMIANSSNPSTKKQEYRITLQCHGIYDRNNNTWWIYW
jgi:hypothetical protein